MRYQSIRWTSNSVYALATSTHGLPCHPGPTRGLDQHEGFSVLWHGKSFAIMATAEAAPWTQPEEGLARSKKADYAAALRQSSYAPTEADTHAA
jgi:hypothetical protein